VITAATPGTASAHAVSIPRILASGIAGSQEPAVQHSGQPHVFRMLQAPGHGELSVVARHTLTYGLWNLL